MREHCLDSGPGDAIYGGYNMHCRVGTGNVARPQKKQQGGIGVATWTWCDERGIAGSRK